MMRAGSWLFLSQALTLACLAGAPLAGCVKAADDSDSADAGGPPTGDGDGAGGDGDNELSGLGGGDDEDPDDVMDPRPVEPPDGYPDGPYGMDNPVVGDVIENLTFFGFRRIGDGVLVSTGQPETLTLADLRDDGSSYALIHTATIWCPSCRSAADDLAARGDELTNQGALLIELVLENASYATPDANDLSSWIVGSDLTVTTVGPADERTNTVFPSREYVYVIDLQTMKVVWADQALFSNPTITELGISALLEYLPD